MDLNDISYSGDKLEKLLIQAVYDKKILEVSEEQLASSINNYGKKELKRINNLVDTCKEITNYCHTEQNKFIQKLYTLGIQAKPLITDEEKRLITYHEFKIIINQHDFDKTIDTFKDNGYFPWFQVSKVALEAFKQRQKCITLVKLDEFTTRATIYFENRKENKGTYFRLFRPAFIDYQLISLPKNLEFLYYLIKPFRVVFGRVFNLKVQDNPYLGTPSSLITPLLDFAGVSSKDYLIDLGCGDGRIIVQAAKKYGCRALGVENNNSLFQKATKNAQSLGLDNRVQFSRSDFTTISLKSASVVFIFLPVIFLDELISKLAKQLSPGTKIIAHEQQSIPIGLKPNQSKLLLSKSAITVAHLWVVE